MKYEAKQEKMKREVVNRNYLLPAFFVDVVVVVVVAVTLSSKLKTRLRKERERKKKRKALFFFYPSKARLGLFILSLSSIVLHTRTSGR